MAHRAERRDPRGGGDCIPIVAVVGATAAGKSSWALDIAERLGGEIVNADAFQLYRGMDIGTAKVPAADHRGIPHHQLDVLDIVEEATVAGYQTSARADLAAIRGRGRVPVLVGGSGLYVRAVLDDLQIPPTSPSLRAALHAEADARGASAMHARLAGVDPDAAALIDPRNVRRVIRALEVVTLTGRPFSASLPQRRFVHPTVLVAPDVPREELDRRIDARVQQMWRNGLLAEVAQLAARGLVGTPTARRAVGYPQALAHLAGAMTADQAIAATAGATRRLARRQLSWFAADPRVHWLPVGDPDPVAATVDLVQQGRPAPG